VRLEPDLPAGLSILDPHPSHGDAHRTQGCA
jgi:hypothetical protein